MADRVLPNKRVLQPLRSVVPDRVLGGSVPDDGGGSDTANNPLAQMLSEVGFNQSVIRSESNVSESRAQMYELVSR